MIARILLFLKEHPSYFKKSNKFLEEKFKCSPNTIKKVLVLLADEKKEYLKNK